MNRKLAVWGSTVVLTAVVLFALSMLIGFDAGSYFVSIFIALGFVVMTCGYAHYAGERARLAGRTAVAFAAMYGAIILLVYFAQLTTVRLQALTPQAAALLDFQRFGLLFSYDLLGYGLMALATFFAGLTIRPHGRADRWLRGLLLVHGAFFPACLLLPMLGLFQPGGPRWPGVAVLEFWCLYFCPVGILSILHFSRCEA